MLVRQTALPAYNVQTAVDAEHALIVAHAVVLDASAQRKDRYVLVVLHLLS
jgi:transposase